MQNFEITFTDHIEATRRAAELLESGVTAKYAGLWDGLYIVEYQANERLPERTLPITPEPEPVHMQYVNRRISDGALWPTLEPFNSPAWEEIAAHPITGRHEVGDTVLAYDRFAAPVNKMTASTVRSVSESGIVNTDANTRYPECFINFSKGDHLSASEREAWHQEATGFQESYYESFNRNQ